MLRFVNNNAFPILFNPPPKQPSRWLGYSVGDLLASKAKHDYLQRKRGSRGQGGALPGCLGWVTALRPRAPGAVPLPRPPHPLQRHDRLQLHVLRPWPPHCDPDPCGKAPGGGGWLADPGFKLAPPLHSLGQNRLGFLRNQQWSLKAWGEDGMVRAIVASTNFLPPLPSRHKHFTHRSSLGILQSRGFQGFFFFIRLSILAHCYLTNNQ